MVHGAHRLLDRKANMEKPSVLVVGSVALDDVDGPFGPHPDVLGGSASFFAVAASYFAPDRVRLVAVVGDDFPEEHVQLLCNKRIDTTGLERVAGKTFHWKGKYSDDLSSRETLDTQLGVFADFSPRLTAVHQECSLVFLGNIHPSLQESVLDQVKAPRLVALDTMNFWIEGARDALVKVLGRIDVIVVNDEEARQLSGVHNLVKAAAEISEMGPKGVVIKRGDAGAILFWDGGIFAVPALPLQQVKDPTGAGDTFAGGFMGYLASAGGIDERTIRQAVVHGSVMASFCVEEFSLGGLTGLTTDRIRKRYDAFHELTRFERELSG